MHLAARELSNGLLVLILMGLAGAPAACGERRPAAARKASGAGERCAGDAQCRSGFCDLDRCAEPEAAYGRSCQPAPRTSDGVRDGKLHTCGAYLCVGERCRSCRSDEQCRSELGSPRCRPSPGRPGARCGA